MWFSQVFQVKDSVQYFNHWRWMIFIISVNNETNINHQATVTLDLADLNHVFQQSNFDISFSSSIFCQLKTIFRPLTYATKIAAIPYLLCILYETCVLSLNLFQLQVFLILGSRIPYYWNQYLFALSQWKVVLFIPSLDAKSFIYPPWEV